MKIGLIGVDSKKFPNLALMKISAFHKSKGDSVEFVNHFYNYDIVYKSKVFVFTDDNNFKVNTKQFFKGGTGYYNTDKEAFKNVLPKEIEHVKPDYNLYHFEKYKDCAFGFLTRGCPNHCKFCIVPEKEGAIKPYADIDEFLDGRKKVIFLDNNVLACKHGLEQIKKLVDKEIKVDFNQGLNAKMIAENSDIAKLLSKLKWHKQLRMACDSKGSMKYVEKATKLLREYGCKPSKYFIYTLSKDEKEGDFQDCLDRIKFLDSLNLKIWVQPYRDLENKVKVTRKQKHLVRFINIKGLFEGVKWEQYKPMEIYIAEQQALINKKLF